MQVLIEYFPLVLPRNRKILSFPLREDKFFNYFQQRKGRKNYLNCGFLHITNKRRRGKKFDRRGKLNHDEDQVENVISSIACNSLIYFSHTTAHFRAWRGGRKTEKLNF